MPFPIEPASSGIRLAPKNSSTTSRINRIFSMPISPNMRKPSREPSAALAAMSRRQKSEQRHVEHDRPDRELQDNQIYLEGPKGGGNARRQELLDRPWRQEPAGELGHESTDDKAAGEHDGVEYRPVLRRSTGRHQATSLGWRTLAERRTVMTLRAAIEDIGDRPMERAHGRGGGQTGNRLLCFLRVERTPAQGVGDSAVF